jgi:ABC-type transporter Mla subunit MlaD
VNEGGRNFLVGLVSIGALAGIVAMLLMFGELDRVLMPRYVVTISTDHASGLRRGSAVELNGVPIGEIDEVVMETPPATPRPRYPVRVTALIDEEITIPASAVPYATSSLLGGSAVLQIEAPPDGAAALAKDGTAVLEGTLGMRLLEQITGELDARMAPVLASLERFDELSAAWTEFGHHLSTMVEPQADDAVAAGEPPNLRTTVQRMYDVLGAAEEALVLAREWLGDDELRADARSAAQKATELIDKASTTLDRFTALAGAVEADADALTKRLLPVADEVATTLEEVRRLARLATEGEGTVSMLLNNPDLYLALEDATQRLERTLAEIQLFIEKAKAEGMPVRF